MFSLLTSVNKDLIAADAKYHKACFSSYTSITKPEVHILCRRKQGVSVCCIFWSISHRCISPEPRSGTAFDMTVLLNKCSTLLGRMALQLRSSLHRNRNFAWKSTFVMKLCFIHHMIAASLSWPFYLPSRCFQCRLSATACIHKHTRARSYRTTRPFWDRTKQTFVQHSKIDKVRDR